MQIPVWMDDWEHECCGPLRRIGDAIEMHLCLDPDAAEVSPSKEPAVVVLDHGLVRIAGFIADAGSGLQIFHADGLAVAIENGGLRVGEAACEGRLWMTQHPTSEAYPVTTGRIRELRWHPSRANEVKPHQFEIHPDFDHGQPLKSTNQHPQQRHWVFCFIVDI